MVELAENIPELFCRWADQSLWTREGRTPLTVTRLGGGGGPKATSRSCVSSGRTRSLSVLSFLIVKISANKRTYVEMLLRRVKQ